MSSPAGKACMIRMSFTREPARVMQSMCHSCSQRIKKKIRFSHQLCEILEMPFVLLEFILVNLTHFMCRMVIGAM